jgi:hypothetical protein
MSLYHMSTRISAEVIRLLSPFHDRRPTDRLSASGLARAARGAVFALLASFGNAGPQWWERGWPQPRVGPRAHPCHPAVLHATKRQWVDSAGAARSPRGRCLVGAAAAVAAAHGEPTIGSVGAAASRMLLARATTKYEAPASSPGGHMQDWPGWKRASPGCSPRARGRRFHRDGAPRAPSTGKRRPLGADSSRSRPTNFDSAFQWPPAAFGQDRRLSYDHEHCAAPSWPDGRILRLIETILSARAHN